MIKYPSSSAKVYENISDSESSADRVGAWNTVNLRGNLGSHRHCGSYKRAKPLHRLSSIASTVQRIERKNRAGSVTATSAGNLARRVPATRCLLTFNACTCSSRHDLPAYSRYRSDCWRTSRPRIRVYTRVLDGTRVSDSWRSTHADMNDRMAYGGREHPIRPTLCYFSLSFFFGSYRPLSRRFC